MKKIFIKLPDKNCKKFRLQRKGWQGRRYLRASSLFNRLEGGLLRKNTQERTTIVVKEPTCTKRGTKFVYMNESMDSKSSKYLLYCLLCFLENHVSEDFFREKSKKYQNYSDKY